MIEVHKCVYAHATSTIIRHYYSVYEMALPFCRDYSDLFFFWRRSPTWGQAAILLRFRNHMRHTTFGSTPLSEGSVQCRDLYLKIHNTHNIQDTHAPAGFEPAITASQRPQTHACKDVAATGIAFVQNIGIK